MIEFINQASNICFAVVFAILGLFITLLHIPKSDELKYYRKSRYILGIAYFIMTAYCILRIFTYGGDEYTQFSLKLIASLLISWLTYSSFLSIIYAERYKRIRFFFDGIIPVTIMIVLLVIGLYFPKLQKINTVIFGVVFAVKCIWMASSCLREYHRCIKDLDNYYSNTPDIKWMYTILWMAAILSVLTIFSFYVEIIQMIYYPLLILIYVFLTIKVINYLPVKISGMRSDSVEQETEEKVEQKKNVTDLKSKIGPSIEKWKKERGYAHPELSIKTVAQEIGTNQNYLSKYINNIENKTFTVWLNSLRIEESKKILIENRKLSIEEVGTEVGFSQPYNFSRWFKQVTGSTPNQYRKSNLS